MNILYLCSDPGIPVLGRKGASIHVRGLLSAFADAGHDVTVIAPLLVNAADEPRASLNARVIHIPPSDATLTAMDAARAYADRLRVVTNVGSELRRMLYDHELEHEALRQLAGWRPDFIYERATVFGTAGVRLARTWDVPLVVELNAPLGLEQATYRGTSFATLAAAAEGWTLSGADVVLTVSAPLRDYVVEHHGVPASRVRVMPNGVDPRVFAPCRGSIDRRSHAGPVLGFVGGLRPWHGVRALAALVERLAHRYPALQLVIAGDGPLRDELVRDCGLRGISERVVFTGLMGHDEIPNLVRSFDVALAPYDDSDHMFYFSPLKVFEYMACGVAVVGAAVGQICEVVRDGVDGLLYAPGDFEGLVAACDRLLADDALRERMGEAGAAFVRARFTWARNAADVIAIVEALCAARAVA